MNARTLAAFLRISERSARRRIAALCAEGAEVRLGDSTGGRPPRVISDEALAARLGVPAQLLSEIGELA